MINPLINPTEDYKLYLFYKEKCRDEIFRATYFTNIKRAADYRIANLEKVKKYQRDYNKSRALFVKCEACGCDVNTLHVKKHELTYKHNRNKQILDGDYNISSTTTEL